MNFKRKIYNDLLYWKQTKQGRTALLIEGARRIGKTFIVKEFGKNEYDSYILIDFSQKTTELEKMFLDNQLDLDMFFNQLQLYFQTELIERKSLIVFDEIQLFSPARQMIKHLVEDGRYDYIETGSLLSLKTNIDNILLPSEEESIKMYLFDFEEFLWALGDTVTISLLKDFYDKKIPLGIAVHKRVMKSFIEYILVGGMPQPITEYVKTKDFNKVEQEKKNILKLYRNDIVEYAKGYENSVLSVFVYTVL